MSFEEWFDELVKRDPALLHIRHQMKRAYAAGWNESRDWSPNWTYEMREQQKLFRNKPDA